MGSSDDRIIGHHLVCSCGAAVVWRDAFTCGACGKESQLGYLARGARNDEAGMFDSCVAPFREWVKAGRPKPYDDWVEAGKPKEWQDRSKKGKGKK
jgi:hypothetical protein